jgi:protein gp37
MAKTNILWAGRPLSDGTIEPGYSFNPWIGCQEVSIGCRECYARKLSTRYGWVDGWGKGAPRRLTSEANWKKPIQWARQAVKDGVIRRVFCASLADIFDEEVDITWKDRLYQLIENCSKIGGLEWLLLTKRAERIGKDLPDIWLDNPPDYVRLGVTAENQDNADKRITLLLNMWHGKNFVSVEPMLSEIDIEYYLRGGFSGSIKKIDWVICGAESGTGARPMQLDWARSLRDQCQDAGVPFFLKQAVIDGKLVKMPFLDGKVWDQYPKGR